MNGLGLFISCCFIPDRSALRKGKTIPMAISYLHPEAFASIICKSPSKGRFSIQTAASHPSPPTPVASIFDSSALTHSYLCCTHSAVPSCLEKWGTCCRRPVDNKKPFASSIFGKKRLPLVWLWPLLPTCAPFNDPRPVPANAKGPFSLVFLPHFLRLPPRVHSPFCRRSFTLPFSSNGAELLLLRSAKTASALTSKCRVCWCGCGSAYLIRRALCMCTTIVPFAIP